MNDATLGMTIINVYLQLFIAVDNKPIHYWKVMVIGFYRPNIKTALHFDFLHFLNHMMIPIIYSLSKETRTLKTYRGVCT